MAEESEASQAFEFEASDGQKIRFADRNEAIQYAQSERPKWNWLTKYNVTREFGGALSLLQRIFASLDVVLAVPQTGTDPSPVLDDPVRNGLGDYFAWVPAIHSRAALQAFILKIASRSEREAVWTLGWLLYRAGKATNIDTIASAQWNQPGVFSGMVSAWQWDGRTLTNSVADQALASVQRVASEIALLRDQSAATLNSAQSASAALGGMAEAGTVALQATNTRLGEFTSNLEDRLSEVVTGQVADLDVKWRDLTKTYSEMLKLKAPAKYWGEKQITHRKQSFWYAFAATVFAVVAGGGLCWAYYQLLGTTSSGTTLPPWGEVLPCAVLAVVFLWVLRTLMRLTMSHIHLALDAEEREIMVQCYLAMTNEGETSGDERGALFAAIFRPTGDGIVKDESPPIPMWEMLKAAKAKPD